MFQSTPFARRETWSSKQSSSIWFQSTPFARRETEGRESNPHTQAFQSTPFARRETSSINCQLTDWMFQSTPFARRETNLGAKKIGETYVSIHSLRKKGDLDTISSHYPFTVSIHSLRKKGDPACGIRSCHLFRFNPLPSQEGRQFLMHRPPCLDMFQSTPFARRETQNERQKSYRLLVSIHSLRKKGDKLRKAQYYTNDMFQSTPFARRETIWSVIHCSAEQFQSTPFARRETSTRMSNGF